MNETKIPKGYKKTEVGVIPEDWAVRSVGDAFEICNQFRLPISEVIRERMIGPYPYYGPTSVQGWINEFRVDGEYALIGEDGDHFLKWRNQSMTLFVRGKFNVNNHAHLIRGTSNLTEWFYWLFSNRDLTPYLARQGAGRYKLNKATLVQIQCALPPTKAEQRAIATALSDVDALIAGLDQLIAKKRDLKQAAMQQLLTGQKRLPGFQIKSGYKQTEVGMIPEDWKIEAVKKIAYVGRGRVINHREISKAISGLYPVYSSQTSDNGVMGYLDSFDFEGEYITWTTDGANAGTVFLRNGRFNCTNVCGTIKLYKESHAFVAMTLGRVTSPHVSRNLGNPKLMNDIMKNIFIILPSTLEEQTAIATILSDMDSELTALEQRRDKTRALKQGMMQELLTGKTRLI